MVFIEQPLFQPLRQPSRRRRSREKITLTATDEFWHSPIQQDLPAAIAIDAEDGTVPSTAAAADDGDCSDATAAPPDGPSGGPCGSSTEMVIPPAHPQLLSDDPASVEDLKGREHTLGVIGSDNEGYASDKSSYFGGRDLSSAKPQGGGSWLMRFVSPDNSIGPEREDAGVPDGLSLDPDECSSSSSDGGLPSDDVASVCVDKPARKGVTFNPTVAVQPIPHNSLLSPAQRQRMLSTSLEVRRNKARNKKEFRHDGWDWKAATEEWEMEVDVATGELVHPAHRECCRAPSRGTERGWAAHQTYHFP